MVKTLKRTSKKRYKTLLHRRKIKNNKLRSKKNSLSKRCSKKTFFKQKGGGNINVKVYIIYKNSKKDDDDDDELTSLPTIYQTKLDFLKKMGELNVENIIGILIQKEEYDWVFFGLNYQYFEKVTRDTRTVPQPVGQPIYLPINKTLYPEYNHSYKYTEKITVDNTESLKQVLRQLCGNIQIPDDFFKKMKKHSHYSCCIRLKLRSKMNPFALKSPNTHNLTSYGYEKQPDKIETDMRVSADDDEEPEDHFVEGKIKYTVETIEVKPQRDSNIKMLDSATEPIQVNTNDIVFIPYVDEYDYCGVKCNYDNTPTLSETHIMKKNRELLNYVYSKVINAPEISESEIDFKTRGSKIIDESDYSDILKLREKLKYMDLKPKNICIYPFVNFIKLSRDYIQKNKWLEMKKNPQTIETP